MVTILLRYGTVNRRYRLCFIFNLARVFIELIVLTKKILHNKISGVTLKKHRIVLFNEI